MVTPDLLKITLKPLENKKKNKKNINCRTTTGHSIWRPCVVNLGFRTYGLVIFINKKDNKRDKD